VRTISLRVRVRACSCVRMDVCASAFALISNGVCSYAQAFQPNMLMLDALNNEETIAKFVRLHSPHSLWRQTYMRTVNGMFAASDSKVEKNSGETCHAVDNQHFSTRHPAHPVMFPPVCAHPCVRACERASSN